MYDIGDTIVAVSSPPLGARSIVRITGPVTLEICERIFRPATSPVVLRPSSIAARLITGSIAIDDELEIDATLYLFFSPHSYTGEMVAEIHIYTNPSVTAVLLEGLLNKGLRMAGPGEFTARAYLNGKIDLAQAEAVNEVIVSSNRFQLAAAEKILSGRLAETTEKIRSEIINCLSLIEAGLDFSGEDIELETSPEAVQKLSDIKNELERLLAGSINCESTLDLPAVGIAGASGAGKSCLLNKLAGYERSIVSAQRKTTRDVLTSELSLSHCRCVLFDCAGLITTPENILDELAQQAAVKSLQNSSIVVFCVDVSKENWAEDVSIRELIEPEVLIPVATKSDLLSKELLANRIAELNKLFNADFLITSAQTGTGLEQLRNTIDENLIEIALGSGKRGTAGRETSLIALTARHRQAVTEAIENVGEAINELKADNGEVAAMLLRAAYQGISGIQQQHVDEEILDRIFSRFCIGK
ncbi:MAG: GTP-binding protein [Sedimentisphaerales bacterium]